MTQMNYREFVDDLVNMSRTVLADKGELPPRLYMLLPGNQAIAVVLDFSSDAAKQASMDIVRQNCDKLPQFPLVSVLVAESWYVAREEKQGLPDGIAPSDCVDRQEVVLIQVEEPGGHYWNAFPRIIRDGDKPPVFEEAEFHHIDKMEGRMAKVLPQNREEERKRQAELDKMGEIWRMVAKIMGRALGEAEKEKGTDHPGFRKFFDLIMEIPERSRTVQSLEDKLAFLERFNSIYLEITGNEIPNYEAIREKVVELA